MKNKINLVQVALCANIPSVRVIMKEQIKQKPNKSLLNESRNVRKKFKNSEIQKSANPVNRPDPQGGGEIDPSEFVFALIAAIRAEQQQKICMWHHTFFHFPAHNQIYVQHAYYICICIHAICILYTVWKCGYSQQSCAHMVIYALAMQIIRILPNMLLQ